MQTEIEHRKTHKGTTNIHTTSSQHAKYWLAYW